MVRTWRRLLAGYLLTVLVAAGCASGEAEGVPEISEVDQTELIVALLERQHCCSQRSLVWVGDGGFSEEDRKAIAAAVPVPVRFYTDLSEIREVDENFPDGEILMVFSKPYNVKNDLVAIDQTFGLGPLTGSGQTWLFQWQGQSWVIVQPEQVGVTVTFADP